MVSIVAMGSQLFSAVMPVLSLEDCALPLHAVQDQALATEDTTVTVYAAQLSASLGDDAPRFDEPWATAAVR